MQCIQAFFSAYKQSQKAVWQDECLHSGLSMLTYDEQREREMRSISSLLIRVRKGE